MLLEDLKLNIRTARANIHTARQSAPSSEFRAWRQKRPFVGTVLTILAGIEMFFSGQLDLGNIHVQVGIEGLQSTIIPVIMVMLGLLTMFMPQHRIFYGVISLVVSVYSLIGLNLGGFFVGMLLGAVGGVLVVSWMPKAATKDAAHVAEAKDTTDVTANRRKTSAEPRPLVHSRS
jgi:hypothetical protein